MTSESASATDPAGEASPLADVIIVGGGIAGLWLLNLLTARGYDALLFEADRLGCQQTLGSQGMIHGGLKYALGGALTRASEAIAGMPDRWRACLDGRGEVDLRGLEPLSERYYLFAEGGSLGRLTSFFASRMLRGRIERLEPGNFPAALERFDGVVYALNDFVVDTPALLEKLLAPVAHRAFRHRVDARALRHTKEGWRLELNGASVTGRRLVLAAGAGTGALLAGLDQSEPKMQLRGLRQVVVRHPDLCPLYAHCLTGISRPEPRLTITSHPDHRGGPGRWLWYLGGQLATSGVERSEAAQIDHATSELTRCVPWIDWREAEFDCLSWDRAEPARTGRTRPDEAYVASLPDALVCWPTKLSLAPDLGDRVLGALPPPVSPRDPAPSSRTLPLESAKVGSLPWAGSG